MKNIELLDQANRYVHAIAEVASINSFTSSATVYALDYRRVAEHDKFTELCRKHGITLHDRYEYTNYAFELTGRKLFGTAH